MTQEHLAKTYQRAVAMIRHAAHRDRAAYQELLSEVEPDDVSNQLVIVIEVAGSVMAGLDAEKRELLFDSVLSYALRREQEDPPHA